MEEKIPVIALVGPTASGKTELGVNLAKIYNGEIVSADSMQIYKGMSIATAKPSVEEMQGIPHHMMDFLDLDKTFSAADYVALAKPIVSDIHSRGKLPIIVGGTGLYVDSLLENITFCKTNSNDKLRQELYDTAKEKGNQYLHDMLRSLDPIAAENIHPNNVVRVVRAIEVCRETGKTFTQTKEESRCNPSPYDVTWIGLGFEDRNVLYDRINKRVDMMIEQGLIEEARAVLENGKLPTASNAIGLKEWQPYFDKIASKEECIYKMKLETRHYAKRQLTWFRRNAKINWLNVDKTVQVATKIETCKKIIAKREYL
jgi:tRNA dimethylallyltransferase